MNEILSDLRHAVRLLWKSPTFTVTAVLGLGLAIGANTALFSILDSLLWKPLPVAQPGQIVRVFAGTGGRSLYGGFSHPEYLDYRDGNRVLAGLSATTGVQLGFRAAGGETIRVFGDAVSDDYFEMLGLRPALGRLLTFGAGGARNTAPEVVLSHRFWEQRLHAAPDVVGKTLWLSGVAYTVVGVTPPSFRGTYSTTIFAPEVWLPLGTVPLIEGGGEAVFGDRAKRSLSLLGRLKPDVDVAQAQAAFGTIAARLQRAYPQSNAGVSARVVRELDTRPEIYSSRAVNLIAALLLGLAGLVLVVACANLANLLLARAGARRKEIAMRLALGASRGRLVRQLLTEALVLSIAAGGVGLLTAYAASVAVSTVSLPTDYPLALDVVIDGRVLLFALAASVAAGVAVGLVPATRASRPDLVPALKGSDVTAQRGSRRVTMSNALVVSQVAVSLVLLVGAGLFWRGIAGARTVDPGMRIGNQILVSIGPSILRYDEARTTAFYRTLLERLSQAPEIENVALASWVPLGFQASEGEFVPRGEEMRRSGDTNQSWTGIVTPRYLDAVGVPLRRGRAFTEQDTDATLRVVIINETFARRAWPGQDPLGRQVRTDRGDAPWLTVVGVIADGKYRSLTEGPRSYLLYPLAQAPTDELTLVADPRGDGAGALAAIRREVRALDPDMPLFDVKTMPQQMAKVLFVPQAMTALAAPIAALAMVIAAIGLYGVIAYSVSRRTREFGIKLAVGAQPRALVAQVMSQGLAVVGVGVGIGGLAALALARVMRGALVGVGPADPAAFAGALGILVGIGGLAIYVPARRATAVDPVQALRSE